MLIVLSPAKTLDFEKQTLTKRKSIPALLDDSEMLIDVLRRFSAPQLAKLMKVSDELAKSTHQQFADWSLPFKTSNAKQAVLAFKGNAYVGLNADAWTAADFDSAQKTLRILSGLHGLLKPLDLIQPYRLEMGTKLKTQRGKNVYEFWGDRIHNMLAKELKRQRNPTLMNLASNEYFKAVKPKQLDVRIITPDFKELRGGTCKTIGTFAKKARGMMASHIIRHQLTDADEARSFDEEGYRFDPQRSTDDKWAFTRKSG